MWPFPSKTVTESSTIELDYKPTISNELTELQKITEQFKGEIELFFGVFVNFF